MTTKLFDVEFQRGNQPGGYTVRVRAPSPTVAKIMAWDLLRDAGFSEPGWAARTARVVREEASA